MHCSNTQICVGLNMTKSEYRKLYKEKRSNISGCEKKRMDQNICTNLQMLSWDAVNYVHVYLPIEKFNEPDILPFVDYLREYHKNIKLVISKSNFESHAMENYIWEDDSVLQLNKWGILEPTQGELIHSNLIDIVLVPLLVVDEKGNRVGYGKGFYDRFLSDCSAQIKKIGISYFEPVTEIDDVGEWDVPLDCLVTGYGIYNFIDKEIE